MSEPLARVLQVLQSTLAMYLADSGIWTYPGNESVKLAIADLVGDMRSIVERIGAELDSRGVVPPPTAYPLSFSSYHDVDMRWLVPRLVAELRRAAEALVVIAEAAAGDPVAHELVTEAKDTVLRHCSIVEQVGKAAV